MSSYEDELLLVTEIAEQYGVSLRTVERWVEQGLPAEKATQEQLLGFLATGRLKGWPPKGVWVIKREQLSQIAAIRKRVGYPRGKPRSAAARAVQEP
jgi:hypothetical protein